MTIRTIRAIAISLLAVLAPASGETTDPHAACPRLPFQLSHHKVVLEVRVGDAKSLTVLLDTGMSGDGLFLYKPETREQFTLDGWTEHRVAGAGPGGAVTALRAEGATFSIGAKAFTGQPVVVLQTDAFAGFPSDGVIGGALFGHHAVEIDYDELTITLHEPKACNPGAGWHRLPLTFKDDRIPWVKGTVSVDAKTELPVAAYIDLASREALEMLLRDGIAYEVPADAQDYYLGRGVSGDIHGKRGKIAWLKLGPFTLRGVAAAFTPAAVRSRQRDADAVLGNDVIRRFDVVFDYAGESLYLKPNSHFEEGFE